MKLKKLFFSLGIMTFIEFLCISCQVVVRQSDRAQIMYVNVVDDSNHLSKDTPKSVTFNFPTAFQNVPKAILSITTYYTNNNFPQAFSLAITGITTTSITLTVEGLGTDIYTLTVGILAIDYPNVDVFTGTLNSGSKTHTVTKKILAYSTFFNGFIGNTCTTLEFSLDTTKIDNYNIKVTAGSFSCISSVDYNLLVIYDDNTNFSDFPFYQFIMQDPFQIYSGGSLFSKSIINTTGPSTQLPSTDLAFYGLKDMKIGSLFQFGIFFDPQSGGLIQNGKYYVTCNPNGYIVYHANALILEVNKLTCPSTQYMYNYNCITPHDGVFCTTNPNICQDCDSNCTKCQNSASNCQACIPTSYFFNNACYNSIQPGTYCDSQNICYQCNLSICTSCVNDANQCTNCVSNYYFYNNTCSQNQPPATYCSFDSTKNYYTCQPCNSLCTTCTGPNANQCSVCAASTYYYQSTCSVTQPQSTACTNYICQPCYKYCVDCFGVNDNECSTCIIDYTLNSANTCIITTCQNGYYPDVVTNVCQLCQKGCSLCTLYSVCTACGTVNNSGTSVTYIYDASKNTCYLNCPSGQYFDLVTRDCTPCDPSCAECKEKTSKDCTSCISGAQVNSSGMCQCTQSQYGLATDLKSCQPCAVRNCNSCFNSSVCDTCNTNSTFSSSLNQCVCNKGYFYTSRYNICVQCIQPNCVACSEYGEKCTQCSSGFLLSQNSICVYCNNYKFSSDNLHCDSNCIDQCQVCSNSQVCVEYIKDTPNLLPPTLCNYTCQTCSGFTAKDCINCSSSTRTYNSKTSLCECSSGYEETLKSDCSKIVQVQPLVQQINSNLNKGNYFAQSAMIFFNLSPSLTYSYQLQQLIGNIAYVNNKETDANQLFSIYTKFNINNLYSLKDTSNSQSSTSSQPSSSSQSSRLLNSQISVQITDNINQTQDNQSNPLHLQSSNQKESKNDCLQNDLMKTNPNNNHAINSFSQGLNQKRNLDQSSSSSSITTVTSNPIISDQDSSFEVKQQTKFFYASIIPMLTTLIVIMLATIIHIYEIFKKTLLKYGYILKWNGLLFVTSINSNYMLITALRVNFNSQTTIDLVMLGVFGISYVTIILWVIFQIRKGEYKEKSFSLINSFYTDENLYSKYYFILMELKKLLFCVIFSFGVNYLLYSIWAIAVIQFGDIVIKKIKRPFIEAFHFYSTISLDILFFLVMVLFGSVLVAENKDPKVMIYTAMFVMLTLMSLISVIIIIYQIIVFIMRRRNKTDSKENCDASILSRSTAHNSFRRSSLKQVEMASTLVKWQKNPVLKGTNSTKSRSSDESIIY